MFKRFMVYLTVALAISGCAAVNTLNNANVPNISPKIVMEMRLGYDAVFLPLALYYKRLSLCPPGVHYAFSAPCKEHAYVIKIQQADKTVVLALDSLRKIAASGDRLTFSVAYTAALAAIHDAEALVIIFKKHA